MKCRRLSLIYPLLILLITGLACSMTSSSGAHEKPMPTRPRRYVVLPAASPTLVPGLNELSLPEQAEPPAIAPAPLPSPRPPRPTATPTPDNFAKLFAEMLRMFDEPTATPTDPLRLVKLPTIPPTPTSTATPLPTVTPWPTDTPMPTATPTFALVMPTPLPADTPPSEPPSAPAEAAPPPVVDSPFTSPVPTSPAVAAAPPVLADASIFSSPLPGGETVPPPAVGAAAPPDSGYNFLLAEFYNSPTTNSFIVIYVAIVDPSDIPIGDMKIVGTRLDHNLTYESPLSTWFYEGYNAPGEVIKSGNVKFEPPGGIETTSWVLHLEDANGVRQSEDVPFDTNANDKQWYFIKFKRKS